MQLNDELEQRVTARTDELLEANRNLQQQITQRKQIAQALRDARDAAEAANRRKDTYLAAASHDLLQPLNAARLLISILRERKLPDVEHVLVGCAWKFGTPGAGSRRTGWIRSSSSSTHWTSDAPPTARAWAWGWPSLNASPRF